MIPALLFSSSRSNWGFEPYSCLSHCDKLKIALWQVSKNPAWAQTVPSLSDGLFGTGTHACMSLFPNSEGNKNYHPVTLVSSCSCLMHRLQRKFPTQVLTWVTAHYLSQFLTFCCRFQSNRQMLNVEEWQIRWNLKELLLERAQTNEAIMQVRRNL